MCVSGVVNWCISLVVKFPTLPVHKTVCSKKLETQFVDLKRKIATYPFCIAAGSYVNATPLCLEETKTRTNQHEFRGSPDPESAAEKGFPSTLFLRKKRTN